MGLNRSVTVKRTPRTVTSSGSVSEVEEVVATGLPASIQPHILNNLPPPFSRRFESGEVYIEEFRCWIPTAELPEIDNDYIVVDEATSVPYRVIAVIDDAGRGHHYLLRLIKYT